MRHPETSSRRGFTLIELLVVIAIIGILSAVVLASLSTARQRGKVSALKAQTIEFRKLMELTYNDTGSYAGLARGWVGGTYSTCATAGYYGPYAAEAVRICEAILAQSGRTDRYLITGTNTALGISNVQNYSIMTKLPDGSMFCAGSSGRTTDNSSDSTAGFLLPGCYSNP